MTNEAANPVTGPIETIEKGPRQRSYVAFGLGLVGSVLAIVGFYVTIAAALNGTGTDPGHTVGQVLLFVGIAFDLIAIVLAIIGLVAKGRRLFFVLALVVALLPLLLVVGLGTGARL